jgi:hypothetical protein
LHSSAEIILEEIRYDRDFITKGDFYIFGKNKMPSDISIISLKLASQIIRAIKTSSPDVIIPGHADNWLGSAIFRIAEQLAIPSGFALEIFYKSKKAVIIDSSTYNNSKLKIGEIPPSFPFTRTDAEAKALLPNHERHTFKGAKLEQTQFLRSLVAVLKSELKNLRELRWRRDNKLERWMLVDQVLPGVNFTRLILTKVRATYVSKRFPESEIDGIKQGTKPVCIVMLHMAPEAANLAFCKDYVNQLFFVEELKTYFGEHVDIFVKDHPYQQLGLRKISFYKKITQLTNGFIFRDSTFTELMNSRQNVYFATLHGSVTFHCAENRVTCIIGNQESFHRNLPYIVPLENLPQIDEFMSVDYLNAAKDSFNAHLLLNFLESQGQVVDYGDDVSGQMELAKKLMN